MKKRKIGNTDIVASVIGLGTWSIGGGTWWGEQDEKQSIEAIEAAIDEGITLIDTAPAYNYGRSEEILGKAIKTKRNEIIITTKCGLWWEDTRGSFFFELDGKKVYRSLHPDTIKLEVENSLRRLQTDYIDIYYTHWQAVDPFKTPISDTMETLIKLKNEGKIRAIGVSNASVQQMKEYLKVGDISTNQSKYSMLDRITEKEILPFCIEKRISNVVYSPLEQGLLTGKIGMDREFEEGECRNDNIWYKRENRRKVLNMLKGWQDLMQKYNCNLSQLVLAWTLSQPGIDFALCGARNKGQAKENARGGVIILEEMDVMRVRRDIEELGNAE